MFYLTMHSTHFIYGYMPSDMVENQKYKNIILYCQRARCSSMVRAFAHGAMGRQIDPSWWTH